MDREHVKGTAEKAKGAIKDTAGKVTHDKKYRRKANSTRPKVLPMTWPEISKTQ